MIKGILPAFVTPLNEDNTINHEATCRLLDMQLAQGADGFYICGATGEGLVMQPEARTDMARTVVRHLAGRVPCISHIAAIDMTTTVRLAREAEAAGCDYIAAIPPIYFAYTEDDIFNYYKTIADSVHLPVMIYYHPAAGVTLSAELMTRLFSIENIKAVKWSRPDYFQLMRVKDMTHGEMNIINGPDEMLLCGLACGADGGIGTTYNFMLPRFKKLYEAFCAGRMEEARKIQYGIDRVIAELFNGPVIPETKAIMKAMGYDVGNATYPMHCLTNEEEERLIARVRAAGLEL